MSEGEFPRPVQISGEETVTEPLIPQELVEGPPIPEGVTEGWFVEVPPLFLHARLYSVQEADVLHREIFGEPGDPDFDPKKDYASTVIEVVIKNRGDGPYEKKRRDQLAVKVLLHNDMYDPMVPVNHDYHRYSKKRLGQDNHITKGLSNDPFTIPPGGTHRTFHVFSKFKRTLSLMPELINKVMVGDHVLWPTRRLTPPPAVRVPADGIVRVILHKPNKGEEPKVLKRDMLLQAENDLGEKVEFTTDNPVVVPPGEEEAYVRVSAMRSGDRGLVGVRDIRTIKARARDVQSVVNPLPTWDPRLGPPKGPFTARGIKQRWVMKVDKEPVIAARGPKLAMATVGHLWIMDLDGTIFRYIPLDIRPKTLNFTKDGDRVLVSNYERIMAYDLERGQGERISTPRLKIEDISVRSDGDLAVTCQGNKLVRVDLDGKVHSVWDTVGHSRVLCATGSDIMLVWNGWGRFQVLDGDGNVITTQDHPKSQQYDGIALSPNGDMVAVGDSDYKLKVLDRDMEVVREWPTLGTAHALAFHPDEPVIAAVTRSAHLHIMHMDKGPLFTRGMAGNVGGLMVFAGRSCFYSTMDGHLVLFDPMF